MSNKTIQWNGGLQPEAVKILSASGGMIVCPTKVGYIIMTSDARGLERKFDAKQRNRNKPGVVLCGSLAQLKKLAQLNPEIETLYQQHRDKDIRKRSISTVFTCVSLFTIMSTFAKMDIIPCTNTKPRALSSLRRSA